MATLARKWFPGREVTTRAMGEAVWLEKDFWEKQRIAVQRGIVEAFSK
jgi:hypothetical protein